MEEAVYKAFLKVSLKIRIQYCSQRYTRRTIVLAYLLQYLEIMKVLVVSFLINFFRLSLLANIIFLPHPPSDNLSFY